MPDDPLLGSVSQEVVPLLCECDDDSCWETISVPRTFALNDYSHFWKFNKMIVLPEHVAPNDTVVERRDGFVIVK